MRTRGTAITPKFAKKVCELYPNINRNWLLSGEGVNRDYTIINENDTAVFVRHVAGGVAPISKTRIASVGYGPKLQPPALAPILKPDPTASLLDVVELQTRGLILTNVWGPSFTVAGVLGLCGSLYGWSPGSGMDPWRAGAVVTSLVFLGGGVACFTIGHNMRVDARGITITF